MASSIESWRTAPVKWWGEDYRTENESKREYVQVTEVRGVQTEERSYHENRNVTVDVTLYLDPATGLVVWDVEAYEKWIGA